MDFKDLLTTDIDRAGKDYSEYQNNGCGLGIGGEDISEWIHHINWCQGKCKTFEGRRHLVQECISHIRKPNRSTIPDTDKTINHNPSSSSTPSSKITAIEDTFAGISLAIIGVSGSGKTALVSKVAQELKDDRAFRDIPLVVRFCGTTDHNNDGVQLLRSLCLQIQGIYRDVDLYCGEMHKMVHYDAPVYHEAIEDEVDSQGKRITDNDGNVVQRKVRLEQSLTCTLCPNVLTMNTGAYHCPECREEARLRDGYEYDICHVCASKTKDDIMNENPARFWKEDDMPNKYRCVTPAAFYTLLCILTQLYIVHEEY